MTLLRRTLVGIEPWSDSGPGWARSGYTGIFQDEYENGERNIYNYTIYCVDMTPEGHIAWQTMMPDYAVLARRFRALEVQP